jgi:hypothetical protein
MKFLSKLFASVLFSLGLISAAVAQTYPTTTPVYIPSAIEGPTTCTAACDVTFVISGVSTVSLQLVGSPGAITASVQGTNQAGSVAVPTWTTMNMVPINGGSAVTSTSAVGFWTINTTGLTKIRAHVTALTGSVAVNMTGSSGGTVTFSSNSVILADVEANIAPGTAPAKAAIIGGVYNLTPPTFTNGQTGGLQFSASGQTLVSASNLEAGIAPGTAPAKAIIGGGVYNSAAPTLTNGQTAALQMDPDGSLAVTVREFGQAQDPCGSPAVSKTSVPVNAAAATVQLVALSGTTKVYVCGLSVANTAGTFQVEYGTGASCGTGTTVMTGLYPSTATAVTINSGGPSALITPAGQALCVVSGAGGSAQGYLTYVQQ